MLYEIFTSLAVFDAKTAKINELYGYPNTETKTETYRQAIKHKDQDLWAGGISLSLQSLCSYMLIEEKALYYNDSDLKDYRELVDSNWFEEE